MGNTTYHIVILGGRGVTLLSGGGDQTRVVFSESLHGGSSDEWVTGLWEVWVLFHDAPFLEFNRQRCRRRVSPKTAPVRPLVISHP